MYNNRMLRIETSYTIEKRELTLKTSEYFAGYVDFEETLKTCKVCDSYNRNWACPPFEENVEDYWHKYDNIRLILTKLNYKEDFISEKYTKDQIDTILNLTLYNERRRLLNNLNKKIREDEEITDSMILSTGYCNICQECSKIENKPCRYPLNKLYSFEALGGLVSKTTNELFETEVKWVDVDKGTLPEFLTILTGVLY